MPNQYTKRLITYNGVTQSIKDWANLIGIGYARLCQRLQSPKWTKEQALTIPPYGRPWRSSPKLITYNKKTLCIKAWAKELGINYGTLNCRLRDYSWSIEDALSTPPGSRLTHSTPKLLTYNGRTLCLNAWAKELGINYGTLRCRFRSGWDASAILTVRTILEVTSSARKQTRRFPPSCNCCGRFCRTLRKKSLIPQGVQLTRTSTSAYEVWRGDEYLGAVRKVGTHRWTHTKDWQSFYTRAKAIEALLDEGEVLKNGGNLQQRPSVTRTDNPTQGCPHFLEPIVDSS